MSTLGRFNDVQPRATVVDRFGASRPDLTAVDAVFRKMLPAANSLRTARTLAVRAVIRASSLGRRRSPIAASGAASLQWTPCRRPVRWPSRV
jgi:hypothetical protein